MKLTISTLTAIVLSLGVLYSCKQESKRSQTPATATNPTTINSTTTLTYNNYFRTWFQTNCLTCHSQTGTASPKMDTLALIKQNSSMILNSVSQLRMPKTRQATTKEISDLRTWINSGLPEYTTSTNTQTSLQVTYNSYIQQYIQSKCLSCHNVGGPYTPDLSQYQSVKNAAQQSLLAMQQGRMPKNQAAATQQEISQFQAWITAGMPQSSTTTTTTGTSVTYLNFTSTFIQTNCSPCHTTGTNQPRLSTQYEVQAAASQILSSVQGGRMPPSTSGKYVSQTDKDRLQQWVNSGAQ